MIKILLASSSIYRRKLLSNLGLDFEWESPDIDETPLRDEPAEKLVARLANNKAIALSDKHPEKLIIASDQVAILENQILGKPHTYDNAFAQLKAASGKIMHFKTALHLLNTKTKQTQSATEVFSVHFRSLTDKQIAGYLKKERPYDCAGSFKSEGLGIALFTKLTGEDPNTLIGLPLIRLIDMLKNEGIDPLSTT